MSQSRVRRTAAVLVVAALLLPFAELSASQRPVRLHKAAATAQQSNSIWDFLVRLWTDSGVSIDANGNG